LIIAAYLFSFLIGFAAVNLTVRGFKSLSLPLHILLSLGLGIGICSLLTFFSFFIFGQYQRFVIIGLSTAALVLLVILNFRQSRKNQTAFLAASFSIKDITVWKIIGCGVWGVLFFGIHFLATQNPYGLWDAWALWNMKTKFLIFGGQHWTDVCQKLHWHTHPDYPLLMPFFHTWVYAIIEKQLTFIPFVFAVLLAMACGLLLYAGLSPFIHKAPAYFASLLLLGNPFYAFMSTAQYADILLAYYLLSGIITIVYFVREKNNHMGLLAGIFLGLMSFTKNEGIVMALLLFILTSIYLFIKNRTNAKKPVLFFTIGLLLTMSATILFKIFIAPANTDILPNLTAQNAHLINIDRFMIIKNGILQELFNRKWCFIWPFIFILIVLRLPKFFSKESAIFTFFFLGFIGILTIIYITTTTFDLVWWLKTSLARIYLYLLPSILFLCFYVHFKKETNS